MRWIAVLPRRCAPATSSSDLGTSSPREKLEHALENPATLLEEAAALALVGAREQGVRVSLRCDHDLPEILVDKIQIQQVALNLIRNAVEAMESHEPARTD